MLPNSPEFVAKTLQTVLDRNMTDYWIINCSNIKPHVFTLDLIAALWRTGTVNAEEQLRNYCSCYYGPLFHEEAAACFKAYYRAALACRSLLEAMDGTYQQAFYHAGLARDEYAAANNAMRSREHGKWNGFYANECLTDVKETAWLLGHYMGCLRNLGDGPHFYGWQREFLYPAEDSRVVLITNMDNHLTDSELFALMKERWQT